MRSRSSRGPALWSTALSRLSLPTSCSWPPSRSASSRELRQPSLRAITSAIALTRAEWPRVKGSLASMACDSAVSTTRAWFKSALRIPPPMRVAVPKEIATGERRVALVPEIVEKLAAGGFDVAVEHGAGEAAAFSDAEYRDAGAQVVALGELFTDAEGVVKVQKPSAEEVERLPEGSILIAFLQPLTDPDGIQRLTRRGVTGFALESVPRITRAQPMDALSSQATVSGYKAVLLAADRLPRFFPMLMTAAGTVPPAKVLVLGAVVSGYDVRPVVREQVESLGASFLDLGVVGEETSGGYARELSDEEQRRQQAELEGRMADFDVVVTTALIPGRPAPKLIPASAVEAMRDGSVIVDLAAEAGGNCELTEPGQEVERKGVTIVGQTNLPSTVPVHASRLFARNVQALLTHLAPDGELTLDWDDEITSGACVTRREEVPA